MIILKKAWRHPYKSKPYAVGTVLQCDDELGTELIKKKIGEVYSGPYPPMEKMNMGLNELKTE
jgi:hypothetical protein